MYCMMPFSGAPFEVSSKKQQLPDSVSICICRIEECVERMLLVPSQAVIRM